MKSLISTLSLIFFISTTNAQDKLKEEAAAVVKAGKQYYQIEMGTRKAKAAFEKKYEGKEKADGVIAYTEGDQVHCVYFSSGNKPKVIASMDFDTTFEEKGKLIHFEERELNSNEKKLILLKKNALMAVEADPAKYIKPEGATFFYIPMLENGKGRVMVLSQSANEKKVIFGGDYILQFDDKMALTSQKSIHPNVTIIGYGSEVEAGKDPSGGTHFHFPETGDMLTESDICILKLNEKAANWKFHSVISQNYISFYNCQTSELIPIPKSGEAKGMNK
ncbi:MAG: hypothetical protein RIQ62_292 [Bacteroidota bacterium]|jgi:hypothetical protein